ncbi:MAG: folylpolyglutamate synthase/dihydrofolate synthase family protein, partial [Candidatus Nanohalobium sp.]
MDYSEAVGEMLENIPDPENFDFREYRNQMKEIGDPQLDIDTVHVAGTNGKGSTCNILYSILRQEGLSVGLFTGPHLDEVVERIEVDGELIGKQQLADLYEEIQDKDFSMFESLTAIAFKHFKRQEVDVAVIETGLGGKRDATNIVKPEASVITNVGLDHSHILGDTVEKIAEEKAGIIKEERPSITNADEPALSAIEEMADEKGSELSKPGKHVELVSKEPCLLNHRGREFQPSIKGDCQLENINTALETLERLEKYEISRSSVVEGLKDVEVPGRMEKASENPEIVLDGAHNREGVKALARSIESFDTIIFGCMAKKPYSEMVELLEPYAENLIYTAPSRERSWNPGKEEFNGKVIEEPVKAVREAEGSTLVT